MKFTSRQYGGAGSELPLIDTYNLNIWTGALSFFCGLCIGDWFFTYIQFRGWVRPSNGIRLLFNILCKLLGLLLFSLMAHAINGTNAISIVLLISVVQFVIALMLDRKRKKLEGVPQMTAESEVK